MNGAGGAGGAGGNGGGAPAVPATTAEDDPTVRPQNSSGVPVHHHKHPMSKAMRRYGSTIHHGK